MQNLSADMPLNDWNLSECFEVILKIGGFALAFILACYIVYGLFKAIVWMVTEIWWAGIAGLIVEKIQSLFETIARNHRIASYSRHRRKILKNRKKSQRRYF